MRKLKMSRAGFTLLEVVFMLGVTSVILFILLSMHEETTRAERTLQQRYNVMFLHNQIYDMLRPASCLKSFGNRTFSFDAEESTSNFSDIADIYNGSSIGIRTYDAPPLTPTDPQQKILYENNQLKVKTVSLGKYRPYARADDANDPKFYSGTAVLTLVYESISPLNGPSEFVREIKLAVNLHKPGDREPLPPFKPIDPSTYGQISSCHSLNGEYTDENYKIATCDINCPLVCPSGYHLETEASVTGDFSAVKVGLCSRN